MRTGALLAWEYGTQVRTWLAQLSAKLARPRRCAAAGGVMVADFCRHTT
jgi:hypothetical protein